MLNWLAPALFALLVSATIRFHSLAPFQTMPRMVGNLLALDGVLMLGLLALGRRVTVPGDIALLLLALAGSATVSVLGSGDADMSLLRLELYLAMTLFAIVVYLAYRDAGPPPLGAFFAVIALVHLPFLFAAVLWLSALTPPFWQDEVRLADFSNVRQFAEFGFFAAASGSALVMVSRRLAVPAFLLAAAALFGIILTGARGAVLSWILFVGLFCCFGRARLRTGLHAILAFAASGGLVWYLHRSGTLISPNIFERMASVQQGSESFDTSRLSIWTQSLQQILVRPLFGSGPEGYLLSECCDRRILQAHNFVLQFLMEFGLIGCVLVLLLAYQAVKRVGGLPATTRLVLAVPGNLVLACLLASFLAYSLIDQTMYHLLPLLHFALIAGLFAASLAHTRAAQ